MRKLGSFFNVLGILCLAAALLLTASNLRDDRNAQRSADAALESLVGEKQEPTGPNLLEFESVAETACETEAPTEEVIPDHILNPNMDMPVQMVDGYDYIGVLDFSDLSLTLPVMSDWDYPRLKISPCRYAGSAYQDDLVIMAHNFASHFGRLSSLSYESIITFTDTDGNVFTYEVAEIEILAPTEVDSVTSSGWDLTLFTCTVGGESRVTVRCERVT